MSQAFKAAVAGAGVFGGYHAKKLAQLYPGALTAVFDLDASRAALLADPLGAKAVGPDGLEALLADIDVLMIASPAHVHAPLAIQALKAGVHVYAEKPLATTVADGEAMVAAAKAAGKILACGHQERAVVAAMGLLDIPVAPVRIECVRLGTPSTRNLDVSVALDLMIHDLDLVQWLSGGASGAVEAHGSADEVDVSVFYDNGLRAVLASSRKAAARERTLRVVYPAGEVRVDFLARTFENTTPFKLNPDFAETAGGQDPLGASVSQFIDAVQGRTAQPLASGEDGLAALSLALSVDQALLATAG